jgi:hypothetical protein
VNLDELVRAAAPPTADLHHEAAADALERFPAALRDHAVRSDLARLPRPTRRRRTRARTVGLALATSLAIAAPVAAGTIVAAHTGLFGNPKGEEGGGEFIRLDSPQFPQVLEQIRQQENLPLPAGDSWSSLPAHFTVHGPSLETTSGIANVVEDYARCDWLGDYITSAGQHDASREARAAQVIEQIPSWPQLSKQPDPAFQSQLAGEARAAAAGHVGDPDATTFDPTNIAQDYQVNCASTAVGR